uniref:Uncharacterized protein n=1 Tax=Glossina austeni TaxID=7395 RepID=A0A1A9VUU8_GLOAU
MWPNLTHKVDLLKIIQISGHIMRMLAVRVRKVGKRMRRSRHDTTQQHHNPQPHNKSPNLPLFTLVFWPKYSKTPKQFVQKQRKLLWIALMDVRHTDFLENIIHSKA